MIVTINNTSPMISHSYPWIVVIYNPTSTMLLSDLPGEHQAFTVSGPFSIMCLGNSSSSPLDRVCFFWHQRPANLPQCVAQLFLTSILVRRWWKLALLHPVLWFLHRGRGKATFHRKAKWWNQGEVIYTLISSTDLIWNQWVFLGRFMGFSHIFPI